MKKVIFLFSAVLMTVSFSACGNKSSNANSVADSDSVTTDTASIDSVSSQTTQQISKDSATVNAAAEAAASKSK